MHPQIMERILGG